MGNNKNGVCWGRGPPYGGGRRVLGRAGSLLSTRIRPYPGGRGIKLPLRAMLNVDYSGAGRWRNVYIRGARAAGARRRPWRRPTRMYVPQRSPVARCVPGLREEKRVACGFKARVDDDTDRVRKTRMKRTTQKFMTRFFL